MMPAAVVQLKYCNRHGGALKLHRGGVFGEVSIVPPPLDNGGKTAKPKAGTHLAISNLSLGVAADLPRSTGRGGARNHADRESHALTAAHVANLKAAERHAALIGLPFTRMITIHWEAAGVPFASMAKSTGKLLDLLKRWLARRGYRTTYIWVHENGDCKGGHCHLLAHIPAELVKALTGKLRGWLRRTTGYTYRKRTIRSDPIGGRLGLEARNPPLHAANLRAALSYLLKGANAEAASQFGLERLELGGRVIGKRCGTSQNIAAKARKRRSTVGYHPDLMANVIAPSRGLRAGFMDSHRSQYRLMPILGTDGGKNVRPR